MQKLEWKFIQNSTHEIPKRKFSVPYDTISHNHVFPSNTLSVLLKDTCIYMVYAGKFMYSTRTSPGIWKFGADGKILKNQREIV